MGGPMFPPGGDMMGPMGPMDLPPELLAMGLGPLGTLGPLDPALAGLMGPDFGAGPQGFGPGGGQGGMMGGGMRGPGGPPGGPMGGMMGGGMGMGPMGMGPMGLMGPPMGGMGGPGGMAGPGGPMMGQGGGPGGPGMMGPPGGGGGMMWGGGGGSMGPPSGPRGGPGGQGGGGGPSAAAIASRVQNDYSQNFVDTGCRPQNYLRDSHLTDRYEEYPKLKELIQRKDRQAAAYATPPMFLRADLKQLKLSVDTFGTKFDVILVDPPWEEYVRRAPGLVSDPESWTWQELQALELEAISDTPCFLFLWCGAEEGLEAGRVCMQKWGFRRCEDICWIKTNREGSKRPYLKATNQHPDSILVHTKEHCLMGIKGTVRRATDGHIIHTNVDTDVIVSEEPELGSTRKPEELYAIIERFSNGRRRLELFGEDHNIRPGWVTVGKQLTSSNFNKQAYTDHFRNRDGSVWVQNVMGPKPPPGSVTLVPSDAEIEALRPKSPPDHRGSSMHSH
ncbi:hypothetical protein HYH03_005303 [Edaphochlamys debaryana]|uniref:Uncharacterized protein n=1 Tax=Edaphochlamys debaryana TaxID=47281 RepID=A0A835Y7I2_9CHLO|nr:hypothetical protein HYH03_005303 [Edaphochlamys debaryana]|eukprot:KAG2496477.1 hypothetical protein HYH03_005303 [Edaphochlamys debaryana]